MYFFSEYLLFLEHILKFFSPIECQKSLKKREMATGSGAENGEQRNGVPR